MKRLANKVDYHTRHIKIRPKLLITFLIISLVPVLTLSVLYFYESKKALEEEIGQYTIEITRQVENRLDSFFHEVQHLANIVGYNDDVQQFLTFDQVSGETKQVQTILNVRELLHSIGNLRNHLRGIFILNDQELLVTDHTISRPVAQNFQFEDEMWYRQFLRGEGFQLLPVHPQNYVSGDPVVTFAVRLTHVSDFEEHGSLLIDFDPKVIDDMNDDIQLGKTGYVFVMTGEGRPINEQNQFPESMAEDAYFQYILERQSGYDILELNGEKTLVSFYTSPQIGWKIVGMVPFEEVAAGVNEIRTESMMIALSSTIVIFLMATYISRAITNPFRRLESMMKDVRNGKFAVRLPFNRNDEIGELEKSFKHMVDELNQFQIREYRLKLLHQESEIKALQAQINPHFLYNTLNTLACIGEVLNAKEVVKVSTSLSQMFQYSTQGDRYASLKDELSHVQAFLQIMQTRFPNRFNTHINAPDKFAGARVLKLVIQPIVENVFIHGMKSRKKPMNIWLNVTEENGRLVIRVQDDGVGISPTKMRELQLLYDEYGDDYGDISSHIGLVNIRQRLILQYGWQAGLILCSEKEKGTIVKIYLPYQANEGEDSVVQNAGC